jgi:hypothetical protein
MQMTDPGPDGVAGSGLDAIQGAPQFAEQGDPGPELRDGRYERPPFPPGSPVKPLGILSTIDGSQKCYYLDVHNEVVGLECANRHGKNGIIGLYGGQSAWLEANFPQWSAPRYEGRGKERTQVKPPEIVGFDQADASRALIEQCSREGVFHALGKLRGRGAHGTASRGLAIHCGDAILVTKQRANGTIKGFDYREPGVIEGFVYAGAEPSPRPWHDGVSHKPGQKLLKLLQTWHWRRALLDPRLLIGWIGAAMLGGALKWRPNIWITGSTGTGKSTINGQDGVLDLLFGNSILRTGNASAAALRQLLKNSTIPVLFDEIEASADNRKVNDVIELARVSSSGATIYRGGADHQAHEFTMRSCFQFSSINIPPLQAQDRSRLGILELLPFEGDVKPLALLDWGLPDLGRQLQRRMVDGWERFVRTLARFQLALAQNGNSRRAADQFGTLLAVADVLLNEESADDEELREWVERCAPDKIAEVTEATPDHQACLFHLDTSLVQSRGSEERETIGAWIAKAVQAAIGEGSDKNDERLQQRGLKLVNARYMPAEYAPDGSPMRGARWGAERFAPRVPGFLAVAWSHRGLEELFQNTTWQHGVWRQALARIPGCLDSVMVRFGHASLRSVLVPLAALMDDDQLPEASRADALAAWMAEQAGEANSG